MAKKVIATILMLLLALSIPQSFAHDLPSTDPSDYIRPHEPEVMELAKKIGKEPFPSNLLRNIRSAYYWVSWNIRYMHDRERWGKADYWQLPSTTIKLRTGDCEDQAILLTSLLRALGMSRENVRMVFGRIEWLWGGLVGYHAWVEVKVPKEWSKAFQEVGLQALNLLENKTLVIFLEEGPLYLNITKETIATAKTLGWGDREGWIPLDPTVCLLSLPGGYKVPIPFSLWLWLGYYVYYLGLVKAIPEHFYVDKPWTYDASIHLKPGESCSVDIPCTKGDYVFGSVRSLMAVLPLEAIDVIGKVIDPRGNLVTSFRITSRSLEASFDFTAAEEGLYNLVLMNNAKFDAWLSVLLSKEAVALKTFPLEVEESILSAELEYIKTEIALRLERPLSEVSLMGASFAIPETLKDDLPSIREAIPRNVIELLPIKLPSEAFLLATVDSLYLVFAERSDKGLAIVEGWLLPIQVQLAGMNLNVVVAKSVSFEKEGSPTTVSEILANPETYKFKLVKVNASRRQISLLYDPDEPPYIEFPLTIGFLTDKLVEPLAIIRKALDGAKDVVFKVDDGFVRSLLGVRDAQGLWVFNFEYEYWYDAQAIVNGIVIPLDHPIFTLFEQSMPILGKILKIGYPVILYDVKTDLPYESVERIADLKTYLGKVVRLTASCYGGYISVQEVIEHNTPCSEDMVYVPGVGCVNLVIDLRLEGFIAWKDISIPPKREELLFVVGVSSFHQDEQFVKVSGNFELLGKVVSTKEISDSLPEGIALIMYGARKISEVDFEKLATQVKDEVKSRVGELYWILQDIYPYQKSPEIPFKLPEKVFRPKAPIFVATPKELPEIFVERNFTVIISVVDAPLSLNISNSLISNIFIKPKVVIRNVTIYFEEIVEKPPDVPSPPGLVYAYHKIDVNVPEASIERASITFWVLKEWLAKHGVTKDNVVMLRYYDSKWLKLPTKAIGENATHFKFTAETPGFSIFAIAIVKISTNLTIAVEPREVTIGGEVTVKGSISPAISKPIELVIRRPDGTISVQTTTSTSDGSFSFKVKLDKEGDWSFIARFLGDQAYEESISNEVKATAKPKPSPCLIATAAFGTELDPHVQHLRSFRDNIVLKTFTGRSFMTVFNAWYYTWSPYVANAMHVYEPFRQIVKCALYPLMGILYISEAVYGALSFNPELGVVVAGIVASLLIGLVYFAPPSIAIMHFTKRKPSRRAAKLTIIIWLTSIIGTSISIAIGSTAIAMTSTSILVLTSIAISVIVGAWLVEGAYSLSHKKPSPS